MYEINELKKALEERSDDIWLQKIISEETEKKAINSLLNRASSQEAKEAIKIADELSEMICFYSMVKNNAEKMGEIFQDI